MSRQQAFYRLQRIDTELDARRARLREITATLEGNAELKAAQTAVKTLNDRLKPCEAQSKELNHDIQMVTAQSGELTSRLYGGKVSNPKELQDIEQKIDELKRRREQLETTLLETMLEVEELQAALVGAGETLQRVEAGWNDEQATLRDEQRRVKKEGRALKADRETAVAALGDEELALYEALRTQRQGLAVAVLKGDMCSGCRVSQTSNIVQQARHSDDIVTCTSCGRILVVM